MRCQLHKPEPNADYPGVQRAAVAGRFPVEHGVHAVSPGHGRSGYAALPSHLNG